MSKCHICPLRTRSRSTSDTKETGEIWTHSSKCTNNTSHTFMWAELGDKQKFQDFSTRPPGADKPLNTSKFVLKKVLSPNSTHREVCKVSKCRMCPLRTGVGAPHPPRKLVRLEPVPQDTDTDNTSQAFLWTDPMGDNSGRFEGPPAHNKQHFQDSSRRPPGAGKPSTCPD